MSGWRTPRTAPQKFPRQATCVAVRVSTVDPEIDPDSGVSFFRSTEATTANLSRGGAFVHSWEPLAAGRRVIVALDLPIGGELALVGRVVWTRRKLTPRSGEPVEAPGYGIEFVGGSRADQAAIQRILDEATPDSPAPAEGTLQTAVHTGAPAQSSAPSTPGPSPRGILSLTP
jgi:Tfp pilus assembly protein PilZ